MPHLGLALMLEQLSPARALDLSGRAERAGLRGIMAADVFQPWVPAREGNRAPHLWSILSAAGAHGSGTLGGVITPNFRHHPATIAQAAATIATMYPKRHWFALSAGEAINDAITGEAWPRAPHRINGVFEAADLIGRLFTNSAAGRDTRFTGELVNLEAARLWTIPDVPPPILIATAGPTTARRAGREAGGFITMGTCLERARNLIDRFAQGRLDAGKPREGGLKVVRLHVSWAQTIEAATSAALKNWPQAAMRFNTSDIRSPFDFAQIAKLVRPEDFEGNVLITTDPGEIAERVGAYRALGFDEIYLHNAGDNDEQWVEVAAQLLRSPGLP